MDFFEAMQKYMRLNSKLVAEVGDRIYPLLTNQNPTMPCIVYTPMSCTYDKNLQQESGFVRQVVQFTVHNTTFGKARKTSRILRQVFKDFSGDMYGIKVQAVHSLNDMSIGTDDLANEFMWVLELEFNYDEKGI